jgi:hypothetical protein
MQQHNLMCAEASVEQHVYVLCMYSSFSSFGFMCAEASVEQTCICAVHVLKLFQLWLVVDHAVGMLGRNVLPVAAAARALQ